MSVFCTCYHILEQSFKQEIPEIITAIDNVKPQHRILNYESGLGGLVLVPCLSRGLVLT